MSKPLTVSSRAPLDVDSTQTVRAISPPELNDSNQPKWYVVQLALSDRPINLETMPQLDVFRAHRLYVVAGKQGNSTRYALRLGFFPDELSADVVCEELTTFFRASSTVRVSAAEHARFAQLVARPAAAPMQASSIEHARLGAAPKREHSSRSETPKAPIVAASTQTPAPAGLPQRVAAKPATVSKAAQPIGTNSVSRGGPNRGKSLAQELLEEARQVQLSRTGRTRTPERRQSWLSRLFGGTKR